jgi:hypothetical protein
MMSPRTIHLKDIGSDDAMHARTTGPVVKVLEGAPAAVMRPAAVHRADRIAGAAGVAVIRRLSRHSPCHPLQAGRCVPDLCQLQAPHSNLTISRCAHLKTESPFHDGSQSHQTIAFDAVDHVPEAMHDAQRGFI